MRADSKRFLPRSAVGGICLGLSMMAGPATLAGPPPELRKLHALLVVDTLNDLGESVKLDGEGMDRLLFNNLPADRAEIRMLTGKDVNAAAILAYYRNLKVTPNDALLFYYAGHGATDPEKGHFMALQELNTKPLIRDDLRRAMEQHRPGLIVIITDCCSDRYPLKEGLRKVYVESGSAASIHPVLRCLLYQSRGVVDITASSGNSSFGDDKRGGIFTRTIERLVTEDDAFAKLDADHDGFLSWPEFFARLRKETETAFVDWAQHQRRLGDEVAQKSQRPRAFSLGSAGGNTSKVRLRNDTNQVMDYQYRWSGHSNWEDGRIAPHAVAEHVPTGGKGDRPPTLEVRLKDGKSKELHTGKTYKLRDTENP
jgi:hypothetical protein